jgi:SAM-dependent methyltransferase
MTNHKTEIITAFSASLQTNSFVKLSLGNYKGTELELKNIYIKLALIKKEMKLSFTYRYKTRDIVKNYSFIEGISIIENQVTVDGFRHMTLCTIQSDLILDYTKKWILRTQAASHTSVLPLEHDRQKNRKIDSAGKKYLEELKITDSAGNVYKATQDKYKQINHYVEILSSLLKELPERDITHVVDMGAGKGYLTFALYDYLTNILQKQAKVIGVEYRKDLVELCNQIAANSEFKNLSFIEGTIEKYETKEMNVIIALHACDTATDDAIYKGIANNADLIVVAPCCHKQIRREIEKNKAKNELDFLIKHGIFLERQAEMVTDGIRALILEYYGYSTKVFEFISDAHTPKNVLIVGQKKQNITIDKERIQDKIKQTKAYFGIDYHHLEKILRLE